MTATGHCLELVQLLYTRFLEKYSVLILSKIIIIKAGKEELNRKLDNLLLHLLYLHKHIRCSVPAIMLQSYENCFILLDVLISSISGAMCSKFINALLKLQKNNTVS